MGGSLGTLRSWPAAHRHQLAVGGRGDTASKSRVMETLIAGASGGRVRLDHPADRLGTGEEGECHDRPLVPRHLRSWTWPSETAQRDRWLAADSSARAPPRTNSTAMFPSWQAYSYMS